ncbi:MAG: GntR family transcriptional regulator [Chloroflexota bacterium]
MRASLDKEVEMTGKIPLKAVAYTAIRDAIVSGKLLPATPVSEAQLQEMLGISRTPIREALQRLAAENLVTLSPNKGAVVTSIGVEDCQDVFAVREMLEGLAASLAARRMPRSELDSLTEEYERLNTRRRPADPELVDFGLRLHATIQRSSGSPRLTRLLALIKQEMERLGSYQLGVAGRIDQSFREHGEIVAALHSADPATAEAAMRRHVRHSAEAAVSLMLDAGTARHGVGTGRSWTRES